MAMFQLQVWTINIKFSYKHAKWYNIPIPIIAVACTPLYYYMIGKFVMEHMFELSWMKYLVMFVEKPWRLCVAIFVEGVSELSWQCLA